MKLRVARHTKDLAPIIYFYHDLLGLKNLGSFEDHAGYHGVFLGNDNWHLEFTASTDLPVHQSDEDDLLVFYCETEEEYQSILTKLSSADVLELVAKNPYWKENGKMFMDPDGFRIVVVL